MGNADPRADEIATRLLAFWGHAFDGRRNDRGGLFRPGTGSAMYYIWHAREIPASADGRLKGQPLSANYAPSLDVPVKGPVSVVRSFTEPDLVPVCNGGPLTIEIHDSAFARPDGVTKVAQLVKFFVARSAAASFTPGMQGTRKTCRTPDAFSHATFARTSPRSPPHQRANAAASCSFKSW